MNTQKFCKNCGKELSPNSKFCKNCGTAIILESQNRKEEAVVITSPINETSQNQPKNQGWQWWILGIFIIFIITGLLDKGSQTYKDNQTYTPTPIVKNNPTSQPEETQKIPTCSSGYVLKAGECRTKDEADQYCKNTYGSYSHWGQGELGLDIRLFEGQCVCETGYEWNKDSTKCVNQNLPPAGILEQSGGEKTEKNQKLVTEFSTILIIIQGPISAAIDKADNYMAKDNVDIPTLYSLLKTAKDLSGQTIKFYQELEVPKDLPNDIKELLNDVKSDLSTAYLLESEALDSGLKACDSRSPIDLNMYEDKSHQAWIFLQKASTEFAEAQEKVGLEKVGLELEQK
ncbi:MAG: zinc-ribbon domain-containing protein [Patescibacteria group bacterium]|nr:zinc-ribbon domain-containing protein [Patescibacteria group bacterium]